MRIVTTIRLPFPNYAAEEVPMKHLNNEINFDALKSDFSAVCDTVNKDNNTVTLSLKNNRKVYLMSEDNYDNVRHFVISKMVL